MEQRTFEGTWEEITRRGSELAGRKVRIIVLNEPASPVTLDRALAHLIADAEHLVGTLPPRCRRHRRRMPGPKTSLRSTVAKGSRCDPVRRRSAFRPGGPAAGRTPSALQGGPPAPAIAAHHDLAELHGGHVPGALRGRLADAESPLAVRARSGARVP